ncbi:MAG: VRR-NUC domain-containing protein [Thermaceae bacterium]|nr:VRR-NUC domain-containing protein [Thermaceae bacterium]
MPRTDKSTTINKLHSMTLSEARLERLVTDYLRACGWFVLKTDAGAGRRAGGNFGSLQPGYPDLTCLKDGQVLLIEVKSPTGQVSAIQKYKHLELQAHGCRVHVVRSITELEAALEANAVH